MEHLESREKHFLFTPLSAPYQSECPMRRERTSSPSSVNYLSMKMKLLNCSKSLLNGFGRQILLQLCNGQWAMESHLPTILTMSEDGTYSRAMSSVDKMEHLIERMNYMFDQAANMDW